ncbi:DsbA family protein [Roseicyclus mahoneyensis]|uniref:Protein-disulfide isomerase n=1 Tax=Roseicyclus mahoneyensis TaxID=164332 RepID=A0A316GN70_9RHOB|nr:DsbA family protein [Roseicyclus mahoneyensis]PWK62239.1 protein-disulfide isomerase [Roseicyclus mahoneyensis]
MLKNLAALGLALGLALPAAATDLDNLSAAERDAFRAEVRAYLLENPEVLMEAIAVLEQRQGAAELERDAMMVAANADALFSSAFDVSFGNPEGDITIVEFMDYRCGYCRRAHPEVADLVEFDGNIRVIVKEFPILGEQSVLASRFAIATRIALGDEAYVSVHDALMEMRGDVTEPALQVLAADLGLDGAAIMGAINDPLVMQTIEYNHALAQRMAISGTPSFVFGDQLVRGYVPIDGMQQIVAMLRETAN